MGSTRAHRSSGSSSLAMGAGRAVTGGVEPPHPPSHLEQQASLLEPLRMERGLDGVSSRQSRRRGHPQVLRRTQEGREIQEEL
jgi:hypothetical protein